MVNTCGNSFLGTLFNTYRLDQLSGRDMKEKENTLYISRFSAFPIFSLQISWASVPTTQLPSNPALLEVDAVS